MTYCNISQQCEVLKKKLDLEELHHSVRKDKSPLCPVSSVSGEDRKTSKCLWTRSLPGYGQGLSTLLGAEWLKEMKMLLWKRRSAVFISFWGLIRKGIRYNFIG